MNDTIIIEPRRFDLLSVSMHRRLALPTDLLRVLSVSPENVSISV